MSEVKEIVDIMKVNNLQSADLTSKSEEEIIAIITKGQCPVCGAPLIYPRGDYAYCEDCGFPDEVRDATEEDEPMIEVLSSNRNWREDRTPGNGIYRRNCSVCGEDFFGGRRRRLCRECASKQQESSLEMEK